MRRGSTESGHAHSWFSSFSSVQDCRTGRRARDEAAPACGSGRLLLRDLLDVVVLRQSAGRADRDLLRLHRLGHLAYQVDGQEAVLESRAGDLDVIGELEAALEGAAGYAAVEHLGAVVLGVLLAADVEQV